MKTKSSIRILTTSAAALIGSFAMNHSARAQAVSITGPTIYTQNFDSFGSAGSAAWVDNSTLAGWYAQMNTGTTAIGNLQLTDGSGAALSGILNMGTAAAADRALGSKATSTGGFANIGYGVLFQNTSASPLRVTGVGYTAELWRSNAGAAAVPETVTVSFKTASAAITNVESGGSSATPLAGTFSALTALNASVAGASPAGVQLDGNLAANRQARSVANAGVTVAVGDFFMLRFIDTNLANTDGYIGIDDLSITFAAVARNLTYNLSHTVGGAPNGIWSTTGNYWLDGASPTAFVATEDVTFSQNPAGTASIDVPAAISAGTVTVSHTSGTYSIGGAGTVSGALVKNGAGDLSLTGNNLFTSASLSGGKVTTSTVTPFGTGAVTVAGPATLEASADLTVGGLAGTAALTKTGTGSLTTTAISASAVTVDINAGKLIIGNAAGFSSATSTINVNAGGSLEVTAPTTATVIAGNVNFNNAATASITVNSPTEVGLSASGLTISKANSITSVGTITKAGMGTVRISGAQALTNDWTITGGFLEAQNAASLGTGTVTANAGWVSITGVTITNPIILNGGGIGVRSSDQAAPIEKYDGSVTVTADSFLTPKRTSTFANYNGYFINGALSGSNSLTVTGPIVAALLVAPFTPANTPVNPSIGATTSTLGAVTLTNGANSYSGNFIVNSQQILSALPATGTGGDVFGTASFTLKGGAIRVLDNGTADNGTLAYNHPITVATPNDPVNPGVATIFVDRQTNAAAPGGANLGTQGTFTGNTVQFSSLAVPGGQSLRTLGANGYKVGISGVTTLSGTGSATFDTDTAPLSLAGGVGGTAGLTKVGAGVLQLAGTVNYAGNTTANAGILDVTGAAGGFSVGAAQTLAGIGTVNGGVTIATGGTVSPGDATGVGALTLSDLALGAGSSLQYSFNAGSVGQVAVTGASTLVPTGGANSVTFNFNGSNAAIGVYPLIDYSGTPLTAGQFSAFKIGTLFQRILANLSNNAANTSVDLNITGLDFPKWTGLGSSEWSTNVLNPTKNWVLSTGGTPTDFIANDKVLFDDSGTNTTVSISVADVVPSTVEVNNPTKAYTIAGAFGISGTTTLVKNGAAKLTITSPNSFTGAVTLNEGVTSVATIENSGANSPLGAGTGVNLAGGTLEFTGATGSTNRAVNLTAGVGSVSTPTGSTLTLAGVVSGAGTFDKAGAGTVVLTGLTNTPAAVSISGGTLQVGDGTVAGSLGTAPITNNGTLAFNTVAAGLLVPNTITGTGGLHKTGAGNVTLNGAAVANTFSGDTVVDGGSIVLSHTTDTNSVGGNVIVNAGGTVAYGTTAGQLANHIPDTATITINGGTFGSGAGNTEAAPTTGVFDTVAAVTLNSGTFLSGRGDATPFTITGSFNVLAGRALLSRGGSVSADSMTLTGGSTVDIDGGSTGVTSRLVVGPNGLVLNGTTINMNAGPSAVAAGSQGSSIVLNGNVTSLVATTINRISTQVAPRAQFDVNGATRTFNVTDTLTLGTTAQKVNIVNSVAASPGGIIKAGPGNLVLAGDNTYDGPTTIQQGTLTLSGTLSGTSRIDVQSGTTFNVAGVAGGYTLPAAQTLEGNGNVVGTTNVGGTVAPGSSIGTLNFANDLIFGAGGQGLFEINKAGAVRTADLANITGALTLAGTLNVTATGDALVQGDKFNLFDAASFTGTMAPGTLPALDPGLSWSLADLGTDGTISVVPEPASAALLVLGSTLLFRRRRKP